MHNTPPQLSSIPVLFSSAQALFKRNFFRFLGAMVLSFLFLAVFVLLLWLIQSALPETIFVEKVLFLIEMAVNGFFGLVFILSCIVILKDDVGCAAAIRSVLDRLPKTLSLLLLTYIIWAIGMIPDITAVVVPSVNFLFEIAAVVFLVISTIYISQAVYIWIMEDATPFESFRRSFHYVYGWWFKVFFRIVSPALLVAAVLAVTSVFFMILIAFFPPLGLILLLLLIALSPVIFSGFIVCYGYALYRDIAGKKKEVPEEAKCGNLFRITLYIGTVSLLIGIILFLAGISVTDGEWEQRESVEQYIQNFPLIPER